ncbi:MAG: aldolase [Bdellovibrionales bacterium RIFOXYC1_FULL_54_43]|nr:MAG: aldolase [Bdellovibrionales bacterium RIFOXYC1_FULL_54_43]
MNEAEISRKLIRVCTRLHRRNLLASADGNVSYRVADERILITPAGKSKALLREKDIAVITSKNEILQGTPSSERLMHLAIYRGCPKARAVVHAHPPTAIAWSVAFPEIPELPSECLSELILSMGRVPVVPYARPGTEKMGEVLGPFLPGSRVMILARHGAVSWGEDLDEAYNGMERLEHVCGILKLAKELGGLSVLPPEEVQALREMRKKLGERIL